jgi:hypothetical protein
MRPSFSGNFWSRCSCHDDISYPSHLPSSQLFMSDGHLHAQSADGRSRMSRSSGYQPSRYRNPSNRNNQTHDHAYIMSIIMAINYKPASDADSGKSFGLRLRALSPTNPRVPAMGKGNLPRPPLLNVPAQPRCSPEPPGPPWPFGRERELDGHPHLERVPAPQPSTSPHPLNFHVSRWTLKGRANSTWEITTWELHRATSNFFFFGGVSVSLFSLSSPLLVPNPGPPSTP